MRYEYPPPPPRSVPGAFQEPQPFQSNGNSRTDNIREHMRHVDAGGPRTYPHMYGTFHSPSQTWSQDWGFLPLQSQKSRPFTQWSSVLGRTLKRAPSAEI